MCEVVKWPGFGWAGGEGTGKVGLLRGVTGEGVRTAPLSVKAAVELNQLICLAQVVNGVGSFGLVVGCLSEPLLQP